MLPQNHAGPRTPEDGVAKLRLSRRQGSPVPGDARRMRRQLLALPQDIELTRLGQEQAGLGLPDFRLGPSDLFLPGTFLHQIQPLQRVPVPLDRHGEIRASRVSNLLGHASIPEQGIHTTEIDLRVLHHGIGLAHLGPGLLEVLRAGAVLQFSEPFFPHSECGLGVGNPAPGEFFLQSDLRLQLR